MDLARSVAGAAAYGGCCSACRYLGFVPGHSRMGAMGCVPALVLWLFNRKLWQVSLTEPNTLICNRAASVLSPLLKICAILAEVVPSRLI